MIDNTLEDDLRAVLISQGPAEGATSGLRHRVLEIPDRFPPNPLWRRLAVPVVALSAAAAAIVVAAMSVVRAPLTNVGPGGLGQIQAGFDPTIHGPGIITGFLPSATIVGAGMAIIAAAVVTVIFLGHRSGTSRGRAFIVVGVAALVAGLWLARLDVGLQGGSIRTHPLGYVAMPSSPLRTDLAWLSTAAPGEPTVGVISIVNGSGLPVRIEGLLAGPAYEDFAEVPWTALWLPPYRPGPDMPPLDRVLPFEPVTLGQYEEVYIYVARPAGACAFGPEFDPTRPYFENQFPGYAVMGPEVTVVYSVFGLTSSAVIDIGGAFFEPIRGGCEYDRETINP